MRAFFGLLLPLFLQAPPADPRVKPGARFVVPFPSLPKTLASANSELHVYIPTKYDPRKKHPLFVWLNGGVGNPGCNAGPVGNEHFVVASMPLYKVKEKGAVPVLDEDAELVWSCYKVMLAELERIVPNLHPENRVIGGFSNGANTTAALLNRSKEFPQRFKGYLLWEGGNFLSDVNNLGSDALFVVYGEKSLGKQGRPIVDAANQAGADADFLEMKGVGHASPPEFHPQIRDWVARKVLYKELPDLLRLLRDAVKKSRWPEAVRACVRAADLLFDDARPEARELQEAREKIAAAGEQAVAKLPGAEPTKSTLETWKKFALDWASFPCADKPREACERAAAVALADIPAQPESTRVRALRRFAEDWEGFAARSTAFAALDEIAAKSLDAILANEKGNGLRSKLTKLAADYAGTASAEGPRQAAGAARGGRAGNPGADQDAAGTRPEEGAGRLHQGLRRHPRRRRSPRPPQRTVIAIVLLWQPLERIHSPEGFIRRKSEWWRIS
jgi:hypothetical protein